MIRVGDFQTTDAIRNNVLSVLDSGQLSYGPFSKQLEKGMANLHKAKYGVLSNSGTSSLQVALHAIKEIHKIPMYARVAIPALTFVATCNIVTANNLIPVLVDVDEKSYNMSPYALEKVLAKNDVRVILPVHLFGQMADMNSISSLAYGLPILQDSCETVLATCHGKHIGEYGDIACFSMYVAHHLVAGVGGVAITNNQEYAKVMRSLVNHGRDNIFFDETTGDELLHSRFRFHRQGYSYRITELEAAIGVAQLDTLQKQISIRRALAEYLLEQIGTDLDDYFILPERTPHHSHSWMMFPIVCQDRVDKWSVCHYLEEKGIETREMLPLTNQPVYEGIIEPKDYPVANWINNKGFYIGCHAGLSFSNMDYIIQVLYDYVRLYC